MIEIGIQGMKELERKLKHLPDKLNQLTHKTMETSLQLLQKNTPEYPPVPPESKYIRTETLGRSLGGAGGKPTVYSIKGTGANVVGTFGTNLSYAQYVIDENRQAYMHKGRWWTMKTIVENTKEKIINLWNLMIKRALGS